MNKEHFQVVGLRRAGKVVNPKHGTIDLNRISDDKALQLIREGFPYLKLTKLGERHYNMDVDQSDENYGQPAPAPKPEPSEPESSEAGMTDDAEEEEQPRKLRAHEVVAMIKDAESQSAAEQAAEGYTHFKSVREALQKKKNKLNPDESAMS